jgi:3-hydroxyisobutyrate dehydrogenase-like beta-hydroxyacid dehydrogenase
LAVIGILHPGEMGTAVGRSLVNTGHEVVWSDEGRSEQTRQRAEEAGFVLAGGLSDLKARCQFIFSICPPHAAVAVAGEARDFSGIYVDANAIAPETSLRILETFGDHYVDGSIIGPPPDASGTTRLYLSGPHADEVAALFAGARTEARVLDGTSRTAASALKMTFAAWTKGSAALLIAISEAAAALGVTEALEAEWALSQPELLDRLGSALRSASAKGWRWEGEMREIAKTFEDVGLPGGFHDAAASVFSSGDPSASRQNVAKGNASLP